MRKPNFTNVLIPFVYFIAGASSLASVAATFFYKEELGLTIQQSQIIGSISVLPWSVKPLYGLLSDRVPLGGLRRKPYLILAGILGSAGYFALAFTVHSFSAALVAVIVSAIGFALADVIVDAIVAERAKTQKEAGRLQSICRASIMLGAATVAYLSGILVEAIGPRNVFLLTGMLPLCTCALAVFLQEAPSVAQEFSVWETLLKLKKAFTKDMLLAVLFVFVWRATPSSGGSFNYFVIDELHFDPEFFGRLSLISYVMGIAGVLIFRKYLISVPLKKLFVGIIFASIVLSLPSLGLVYGWYEWLGVSPKFFAMADTFVSAPLTEIAFLPLLVLATRLCPAGIEATMFALLASIMNIGLAVSDLGGAALVTLFDVRQATETMAANYVHIDKVLWIAILSSLLPLPFIRFLPETRAQEELVTDATPSMTDASGSSRAGEKEIIV